jgi:hypothetical protein
MYCRFPKRWRSKITFFSGPATVKFNWGDNMLAAKIYRTAAVMLLLFLTFTLLGCQVTKPRGTEPAPPVQKEPDPKITSLTTQPQPVCLNRGHLMRIDWRADLDGWSNPSTLCVQLLANGTHIHDTLQEQCLNSGTTGQRTFDVVAFFGGNPPSQIDIEARLVTSVAQAMKHKKNVGATIEVDCQFIPIP